MGIHFGGHVYLLMTTNVYLQRPQFLIHHIKTTKESIIYHFAQEGLAQHKWQTAYINTNNKSIKVEEIKFCKYDAI